MRTWINLSPFLLLILLGCDDVSTGTRDSGPLDGGGFDARSPVAQCERDIDCEDGRYCTQNRCQPGADGTDAAGCIVMGSPCNDEETCVESARQCQAVDCSIVDHDGDGHNAMACGGDDCDDDDPLRFPGNSEVCDPDGHDEDCSSATLAGASDGDNDGDGDVSWLCCNDDACGPDCDDSNPQVNVRSPEVCNGIDDDCSGRADDVALLCPGGLCEAGRCEFREWDRTFGSGGHDLPDDVAIDAHGDVYVLGTIGGPTDFGEVTPRDLPDGTVVLIKYRGADGVMEWIYTSPAPTTCRNVRRRLAVGGDGSAYFVGFGCGIDYGSGVAPNTAVVVQLRPDGTLERSVRFGPCTGTGCFVGIYGIAVTESSVALAGAMSGAYDFGDGVRDGGSFAGLLVELDRTLAFRRARVTPSSGGWTWPREIQPAAGGGFVVAGQYNAEFGLGGSPLPTTPAEGNGDPSAFEYSDRQNTFVARLNADFTPVWASALAQLSGAPPSQAILSGMAVGVDGGIALAGRFVGQIDFGGPAPTHAVLDEDGFVVALAPDGSFDWVRSYDAAFPRAVATTATGTFAVAGYVDGPTNFGAGTIAIPAATAALGFLIRLDPSGRWAGERLFGTEGDNDVSAIAIGPGDATQIVGTFSGAALFGSATRLSAGLSDVFVLRPPS